MKTTINTIIRNIARGKSAVITILFMVGLLVTSTVQANDLGMKLAKDRSIPGKNQIGECAKYADALFAKMNASGVEAYRVSFDWSHLSGISGGQGAHAVVVFKDARGRYYGVDNMTWKPIWLKGNNSQEWATFIAGMDTSTSVRNTVASKAASFNGAAYAARN